MSLLVRFRIAVVDWYIRARDAQGRPSAWDDLEGMGRRLASPASRTRAPSLPTSRPVRVVVASTHREAA